MRTSITLALFISTALASYAQHAGPQKDHEKVLSSNRTYVVGEIGPHHRQWLKVERDTDANGRATFTTNRAYSRRG